MAAGRIAAALALLISIAPGAHAQTERILNFFSDVDIKPDSRLDVFFDSAFPKRGELRGNDPFVGNFALQHAEVASELGHAGDKVR